MQIYLSYLLDLHEIVDYHIVHSHRAVPHMPSNWFKTTNNTMCQILKVTYMSCLGRVFESLTNKIQILEDSEVFGTSGFWFWAIEPIHKTGNDGKLPVWLNLMLFYCSVFFETADYNVWKSFFGYVFYCFPSFPAFSSNRPGLIRSFKF